MKNKWRNWQDWFKGGVVGLAVFGVLLLFSLIFYFFIVGEAQAEMIFLIPFFAGIFAISFFEEVFRFEYNGLIEVLIFSVVIYFLVGALVGWIVGRVRIRKRG